MRCGADPVDPPNYLVVDYLYRWYGETLNTGRVPPPYSSID